MTPNPPEYPAADEGLGHLYARLTSRTWLIIWALIAGCLLPEAHVLSPAIRWLAMAMLSLTYLGITLTRDSLRPLHFLLVVVPPVFGLLVGHLLRPLSLDLAVSSALVTLAPTAAAAPVLLGLIGRRSDFGTAAVILSNLAAAFYLPPLLATLAPPTDGTNTAKIVVATLITVLVPALIVWPLRLAAPRVSAWRHRGHATFGLWLFVMFLIAAQASHFLRKSLQPPWWQVFAILAASLLLCLLNFSLGRRLGSPDYGPEASQCLGQKNTVITLWIALAWYGPMVAIGPASYVLWHNLYNSWQLSRTRAGLAIGPRLPTSMLTDSLQDSKP